jgi:uncharacterized protein YjbI with pentapeptide repeats
MARYRRNGTPIGDYNVYAITVSRTKTSGVFLLNTKDVETYEDLDMLVMLEEMSGRFGLQGVDFDRLVVTKPGANLSGAYLHVVLNKCNLEGANFYPERHPCGRFQGLQLPKV